MLGFLWLSLLLGGAQAQPVAAGLGAPAASPAFASNRRMAERLRRLAEGSDPRQNGFLSRERVRMLSDTLRSNTNHALLAELGPLYARELLQAGQSERAMRQFQLLQTFFRTVPAQQNEDRALGSELGAALASLRLGEQENCLAGHTPESCLIPLRPGGFHQIPRGSLNAIPMLTNLLTRFPDDLRARWLLNLAHMTLGQWPDGVPAAWRIGPEVFAPEAPFPRFPEVAGSVGLDTDDLGGGVAAEDFDGDGLLDAMVSAWGLRSPLRWYRQTGKGDFEERTGPAGLEGLWGGLNLVTTDYNNDGRVDVLVLRGAWLGEEGRLPNSLLRNNGDGTFTDVTEEAGLLSFHPTQTAAWFDLDGDGWLDLFIGNETQDAEKPHPCELYRNNRDGTFTEIATISGVAVRAWVKGVAAGDYDGDGRPDLYLSVRDGANYLFRNEGPARPDAPAGSWSFREVGETAGVRGPHFSFPTWFFDYDQDGRLDLFVSGYRIRDVGDIVADLLRMPSEGERARLYRNRGDGTFSDVSREAGVDRVLHAMGSNFGDLDNDGYPDFYLGTGDPDVLTSVPNRLFWNAGGRRFFDVTTAAHLGHLQKGHGCAFADLDNDGDQDVFMNMGGAYSGDNYRDVLFRNPGNPTNRWLTLKLEGVKANRAGLGARIRVEVDTPSGARSIYRWVGSGGSFGANPLRAEIGLGAATAIRAVEIQWPVFPVRTERVEGVTLDGFFTVREGEPVARRYEAPRPAARPAGPAAGAP